MNLFRQTLFAALVLLVMADFSGGNEWIKGSDNVWRRRQDDVRRKTSVQQPKCTRDIPCYDVTLVNIFDGICAPNPFAGPDPKRAITHYAKVNRGIEDIISDGKMAAQYFKRRTGFDFTGMPDKFYLFGEASILNGSVVFTHETIPEGCGHRTTVAQYKEKTQLINKPISDFAFALQFRKATRVYGEINDVIPANSFIVFASYIVEPCGEEDDKCESIFFPDNPRKPFFIRVTTREYLNRALQPGPFMNVDCLIYTEDWGNGIARGTGYSTDLGDGTVRLDLTEVLRFKWPPQFIPNF